MTLCHHVGPPRNRGKCDEVLSHPERLMLSWPERISDIVMKAVEHRVSPEPFG